MTDVRDWTTGEQDVLVRGVTEAEVLSDRLYSLTELLTLFPLQSPGAGARIRELADHILAQSTALLDITNALASSSPVLGPGQPGFERLEEDG